MERIAVQSRDLALVGYDEQKSILEITFRAGGVYHYAGVPKSTVKELLGSDSLGQYFNDHVRNNFPYTKIS